MPRVLQFVLVAMLLLPAGEALGNRLTFSEEIGAVTSRGSLFPTGAGMSSGFYLGYERKRLAVDISLGTLVWPGNEIAGQNLVSSARALRFWQVAEGPTATGSWAFDAGAGLGAMIFKQRESVGTGVLVASALRMTLLVDKLPSLFASLELRGEVAGMHAAQADKERRATVSTLRLGLVTGVRF